MPTSPLTFLGFGFVLGIRHALDVDHLAAVSTIVSGRRGFWGSSLVGACWGLGHSAALLVAAAIVIAFHAGIPARLAQGLELGVAVMLVALGVNLLRTLWSGGTLHHHAHVHGGRRHVHPHMHESDAALADHDHGAWSARRPFLVGLVHGLAGSGGLMLAVVAAIPTPALALAYVGVFGIGALAGMALMSALLGLPLLLTGRRFRHAQVALATCAALGSVAIGLLLAGEIVLHGRAAL